MNALITFVQAAASYYGVPVEQLTEGSGIATDKGDFELVLRFKLEPTDLAGVLSRMQEMRAAEQIAQEQAVKVPKPSEPTPEQWRDKWNSLSRTEKSAYGSFARFKASVSEALVFHTSEPVELPTVVWLARGEATEQQKAMAIGVDERGRIGVDPDDLTEEQRFKYMHDGATGG